MKPGDWNRYAYVLYNPANFNDPSGHIHGGPNPIYQIEGNDSTTQRANRYAKSVYTGPQETYQPEQPHLPAEYNDYFDCMDLPYTSLADCEPYMPGYEPPERVGPDFSDGFQVRFRSWEEIDKLDFWLDVGGIGCDVTTLVLSISGPWANAINVGCSVVEVSAMGKTVADLGQGDPTGSVLQNIGWNVYIWSDVISNGTRAIPLPAIGITSNVISLATNWIAIE